MGMRKNIKNNVCVNEPLCLQQKLTHWVSTVHQGKNFFKIKTTSVSAGCIEKSILIVGGTSNHLWFSLESRVGWGGGGAEVDFHFFKFLQ